MHGTGVKIEKVLKWIVCHFVICSGRLCLIFVHTGAYPVRALGFFFSRGVSNRSVNMITDLMQCRLMRKVLHPFYVQLPCHGTYHVRGQFWSVALCCVDVAHMRRGCETETDIKASSPRMGQKAKYSLVKGIHNGQVLMHAINTHVGSRHIRPRFHNPGSKRWWVVRLMTRPIYLSGRRLITHCILGWVGPSGAVDLWDKKKMRCPVGYRNMIVRYIAWSPYRRCPSYQNIY